MSNLKVCRVCLSRDVKMYNMLHFELKVYYEEILNENVTNDLLRYFCYECSAMLHKYHKFREKCLIGQEILKEIMDKGPITMSSISKVDRKSNKLLSTIENMRENKQLQKIMIINTASDLLHIKTESVTAEDLKIEFSEGCNKNNEYDKEMLEIEEDNIKMEKHNVNEENMDCSSDKCDGEWETELDNDRPIIIVVEEKKTTKNNIKNEKHHKTKDVMTFNKRKTKKGNNICKADKKKGGKRKRTPLDPEHWLKISLDENEALEMFKQRAEDPKYLKAMYKCDSCYTSFSSQEIMDRHMKLYHCESRLLECQFCHKRFNMKWSVTQHIEAHYNKFKCLRCDLTFQSEYAAGNHNVFHSGVMLPCKHCGMEFRHQTTYYSHLRIYHRSEHVCPLCGESFVSGKGLKLHKILKHRNAEINRNGNEDQTTYCERCDIMFVTQKAYSEHLQQSVKHANDYQLSEEQDQVGTSDMSALLKGGTTKTFTPRMNMSRPTTCPVCKKLFRSCSQYVKHHRAEHKGVPIPCELTHVCEICGLTVKGALSQHMNVHTKEKKYSCQTCGAQFCYITSFTRHQLIHTGEKPFKCPLCEKRFTQKASMQLHHRTFHLKQPYPKRIRKKENIIVQVREDISE